MVVVGMVEGSGAGVVACDRCRLDVVLAALSGELAGEPG